jgi:ABC-type phosphate/phosphonate transport system permease subunit
VGRLCFIIILLLVCFIPMNSITYRIKFETQPDSLGAGLKIVTIDNLTKTYTVLFPKTFVILLQTLAIAVISFVLGIIAIFLFAFLVAGGHCLYTIILLSKPVRNTRYWLKDKLYFYRYCKRCTVFRDWGKSISNCKEFCKQNRRSY